MLSTNTLQVKLAPKNPILAPKNGSLAFRVKVQLPYLHQADELFNRISQNSFTLQVDSTVYEASLNHELESCFRIIPGSSPVIEICMDVYTKSFDTIYYSKNISIIL